MRRIACFMLIVAGVPALPRAGPTLADDAPVGSLAIEPAEVETLASANVRVAYRTARRQAAPRSAELWVTSDRSRSWSKAREVDGKTNPIPYDAPVDGLYGFYVVLTNEFGASSPPPQPGTAPIHWVRVDRAPPRVQLLSLKTDPRFDLNREVFLRWSSEDENPVARPIALHYRTAETRSYQLIADFLPASGSFRWTVPPGIAGRVDLKLSAVDAAGHSARYIADTLRIDPRQAPSGDSPAASVAPTVPRQRDSEGSRRPEQMHTTQPVSRQDAEEAKRSYEAGTWRRIRGERAEAIARYRDALERDPNLLAARIDLAGVLLITGDAKSACREYELALQADGENRAALRGLALASVKVHNYTAARQALDKLLQLEPRGAEAWLNLGDVALFLGDRPAAREAWRKAGEYATEPETARRAERRLASGLGDSATGGG